MGQGRILLVAGGDGSIQRQNRPLFCPSLFERLKLPEAKDIGSLDSPLAAKISAQVIRQKSFLNRLYRDFYQEFKRVREEFNEGVFIEIGSGGGFLKRVIPDIITSDILPLAHIDMRFSAVRLPFKSNGVDCFFMFDVFHHVQDAALLLREMGRCLKKGGKIVMIEPANTPWARLIYQNFHHEVFDPFGGWTLAGSGPLSSANGALPWIIFYRDARRFEKDFPALKVKRLEPHTPFRYLISGGLSFKQLLPTFTYNLIKGMEIFLSPLNPWLGMFVTIEIEKTRVL